MPLKLYNTFTKKLEDFVPLTDGEVGLYACGPTVYNYAHVGNLRAYLAEDVLKRALTYTGYSVTHVMNITDVGHLTSNEDEGEDKVEAAARRAGKSAWDIAKYFEEEFLKDMEALGIVKPEVMPRATEHIAEQIELVKILMEKGFAYETSDGVYFDTKKFPSYGKLGGQRREELRAGARVLVNPEKRDPHDFALWKRSTPLSSPPYQRGEMRGGPRQMEWPSPWGTGFPGWHLECSAMSKKYLGQPFDIHCGGIDHIPVHHENEIAQSEAAYGELLAALWFHVAFLTIDGRRMGKSEGNLIRLSELGGRGFDPLAFRYFCLGAHYRTTLNFTWEAMGAAQNALFEIRDAARAWPKPEGAQPNVQLKKQFAAAIEDDLNTPEALAALWRLIKTEEISDAEKAATLLDFDRVLGLGCDRWVGEPILIPEDVQVMIEEREAVRTEGDFKKSDALREKILERGFVIEDTPRGPRVKENRMK